MEIRQLRYKPEADSAKQEGCDAEPDGFPEKIQKNEPKTLVSEGKTCF